jgi:AAA15 family ATPase/GTPase
MKITIKSQKNSSITEKIDDLEIDNYTIFAGQNNSGKTNLIKAIMDHEDFVEYKKIFIPAQQIQPQTEQTKNSAGTTPFFKLMKSILVPIFDKNILKDLINKFDNSSGKKNFVDGINEVLKDFGVEKKRFGVKISEDQFKEDLIIKIIKAFVKDLYETDVDEVDFENIGMGTQRLIVAALIKYYQDKGVGLDEKMLIIFEEPEVYLHPRLKKGLYDSLLKLSKRPNTIVLITTHDPYFIELGKKQRIYQVRRSLDPDKKDATEIKLIEDDEGVLPYRSDSEINYIIFDLPSKTYFLELYEHLLSFFVGKDTYGQLNIWISKQVEDKKISLEFDGNNPLVSKLRHQLGHPRKETEQVEYINDEYLCKRIVEVKKLIKNFKEQSLK